MPPQEPERGLMPSVLDRLLDDRPDETAEPPTARGRGLRELKAAVRRDLEFLLNARCNFIEIPEDLPEARKSLLMFGLPDFSTYNLSNTPGRQKLVKIVEKLVRQFEPRLSRVEVSIVQDARTRDRSVQFRIDGLLRVDPSPEPVSFDTLLLHNNEFRVQGDD
jgi:type VI secretion system protein ImpF